MGDTLTAAWQPLFGLSTVPGLRPAPSLVITDIGLTASPDGALRWHGVLTVEGVRTCDRRELGIDSTTWRDLPIALTVQNCGPHGSPGPAPVIGAIETITREGTKLMGTGYFDTSDAGAEVARQVKEGLLRWVSVDLEVMESELIEVFTTDQFDAEGHLPEEGDWWERVTKGRIAGAAVCPVPAFPQAVIAMEGVALPMVTPDNGLATVASGAPSIPAVPPAEWFADPGLNGPTRLTIDSSGRLFGHVAAWGVAHIGLPVPTYAPHTTTGYAHCLRGSTEVASADGPARIATGVLTMDTGHAGKHLGPADTVNHYDNTGTAAGTYCLGEDTHGIWMAGAALPSVTDDQLRLLQAVGSVSGDWRRIGGAMELVAVLAVNVPGFPIPSLAASASIVLPTEMGAQAGMVAGEMVSLVAAGIVAPDPVGEELRAIRRELSSVHRIVDLLRPSTLAALAARFGPPPEAGSEPTIDPAERERLAEVFSAERRQDAAERATLRANMSDKLSAFLPGSATKELTNSPPA